MEGTPDAAANSNSATVCLMENEDFLSGLYVPSERHFTDPEADARVPGPDSELHLDAGWSWSGPWMREDWTPTESGRRRRWRRDKSRAEWVILEPPAPGGAAEPAAAGASTWTRLYSTFRTFSSSLLQPAADRTAPVNVRRVRAVVALARLLAADHALLPLCEMIENARGAAAGVAAAAAGLKAHAVAHWLEDGGDAVKASKDKARAVLAALGRVARAADKESDEYLAAMNAMQPLVYLCGALPEDDDAAHGEHRSFVVADAAGAAVEMALYEDVLVRGASEVLPLDWLWIAFQREKQLAKLITLSSSFAFVAPPDVLDLLRGAVARWLARIGAIGGSNRRSVRFWCPEFVYRGSARAGQFEGRGMLMLAQGDVVYSGFFEQGRRSGKGMQVHKALGVTYKGGWRADRYEGRGVLHFSREHGGEAFKFIGHFRAGLREGPGVLYRSDGSRLSCTWRADAPQSPAARHSADGGVYAGGWANNAPHGLGVEALPHGRYCGEWAAGQRSGRGVFENYVARASYAGVWAAGALSGRGNVEIPGVMSLQGTLQGSPDTGELTVAAGRLLLVPAAAGVAAPPCPFWSWFVRGRLETLQGATAAAAAATAAREGEAAAVAAGATGEALDRLLQGAGYAALLEEFGFICGAQLDRALGAEGVARSRRDYLLFIEALRDHVAARLAPLLADKSAAAQEALEASVEQAAERATLAPAFCKQLWESCEEAGADAAIDAACARFAKLSGPERTALLGEAGEAAAEAATAAAAAALRGLSGARTPRAKLGVIEAWLAAAGGALGEQGLDALLPRAIASVALACVPCLATERRFVEECMAPREREAVRAAGLQGYAWATFCSCLAFCETLARRPPGAPPPELPLHVELEDPDSHLMLNSYHRDVTPPPPGPARGPVPRVESADYVLDMDESGDKK